MSVGRSKHTAKRLLTRMGARCSGGVVYNLNGAFNYLHVGWWLREHDFGDGVRVEPREQLWNLIADELADRDVLYLASGVHQGASIRYWSRLLRNPRARLHGFDSFLGLPHDWTLEGHERGYFSTNGSVPQVDDPRV